MPLAPRSARSTLRAPGIDWMLMLAVLALVTLGSLLVWSATSHRDDLTLGDPTAYLKKQLVNIAIGLVLLVIVMATDHRWVRIVAPLVYLASIVGLALVLTMGSTINGSRSWLELGSMSIQPSEFAKLAVVIGMALLVAERAEGTWRRRVGTADVAGMLATAGLPRRWLAGLAGVGVAVATFAVTAGVLKEYQILRFMAFTDPSLDPRGAGYNVEQARIAVGNGGVFGQGLFHGSQTRSGFVPEQHTDFIFTVAGEELGLVGAGLLIALLAIVT